MMDGSGLRSRDIEVRSGPKWVGGRRTGQPRRHCEHEELRARCWGPRRVRGQDCAGGGDRGRVLSGAGASDRLAETEHDGARVTAAVRGTDGGQQLAAVVWLSGQSTESWTDGAASADLQTQTLFEGLAPGGRINRRSPTKGDAGRRCCSVYRCSRSIIKRPWRRRYRHKRGAGDGTIFDAV